MTCQHCKKQPATVHVSEIIHGVKHERYFCVPCATKQKIGIVCSSNLPKDGLDKDT